MKQRWLAHTCALMVGSMLAAACQLSMAQATDTAIDEATSVAPKTSTTTTLAASPNPAKIAKKVTLTAVIAGTAAKAPTGTVTFSDGGAPLGTATLKKGRATLSVTFATAGTHALAASYAGDGRNTASSANGLGSGDVALLLHMDGVDGSNNPIDASSHATAPWSTSSTWQVDTANAKFGAASIGFGGGFFSYQASPEWDMADQDFTAETWARFDAAHIGNSDRQWLFGQADNIGGNHTFGIGKTSTDQLWAFATVGGIGGDSAHTGTDVVLTGATAVVGNTWYHLALVRHAGVLTLYKNGVVEASAPISGTIVTQPWSLGVGNLGQYDIVGGVWGTVMLGQLDDVRITKGAALYTAPFTPPTAALPDPVMHVTVN